jgi:TPR repeat protein
VTVAAADSYEDAVSALGRRDFTRAVQLFRPLAEQGNLLAQVSLGRMYHGGHGVPQDYQEALTWFRKAADQADAQAQSMLGGMYASGLGSPQDYQEAVKWYRKAAQQGNTNAQNTLGRIYANGKKGVPQDFVRAHMWSTVAAAALSGDTAKSVMKNRDIVTSRMTMAQIEKAQEMARHCQATKFKECN